jgi:hypothetical protein
MGVALPLYRVCLPEVEPGVDDTPLGAISTKVDGQVPSQAMMPGVRVVTWWCGALIPVCLGTQPWAHMVPAPGSSGAVGLGVARLLLLGYPDSLFSPVNWGQVENNTEQACSQVKATKRMLLETLATVGQDILHAIQVSLKKSGKFT